MGIRFIKGRYYRHENMLDTCILVLHSFFVPENGAQSIRVQWWRLYWSGTARNMQIEQRFKIRDASGWHEVKPNIPK